VLGPQVPPHPPGTTTGPQVALMDPPGAAPLHRVVVELVRVGQAVHAVTGPHHLSDRLRGDAGPGYAWGTELDARVARDDRAPTVRVARLGGAHGVSSIDG